MRSSYHLFEPFHSVSGGPATSGVGLATVYGLVRTCGGGISVTGTLETGFGVEILLPLVTDPRAGDPANVHAHTTT
jgi:two-component system cell cycle sensor histidine kinase/response regulator CckA